MMIEQTTCCWNCSTAHEMDAPHCPECGAINPNVDFEGAMEEMQEAQAS